MLELLKIAFILKNLFTENRCPKIFLPGTIYFWVQNYQAFPSNNALGSLMVVFR